MSGNVKKIEILKKIRFLTFYLRFIVIFGVYEWKYMLNMNKILMKAKFIEKMKILLSKAGLRELLRLELTPGN